MAQDTEVTEDVATDATQETPDATQTDATQTVETQAETSTEVSPEAQPEAQNGAPEAQNAQGDSQESASAPAISSEDRERAFYGNAGGQSELKDALSPQTDSDAPRKDVPGGRAYEIIYIARVGDAEASDATGTRLRELIEGAEGAIDNVRATETRRLAYPVGGENDGIYMVVNARIIPTQLPEIDRFFKLEESVLRHMVLKESGQ